MGMSDVQIGVKYRVQPVPDDVNWGFVRFSITL